MKTVVLDTNILIDNVYGFAPWIDILLNRPLEYKLLVPTVAVAEYLTAQEIETARGKGRSKKFLSLFQIQDLTFEIAEVLGTILRRKTYPHGTGLADLIIASTAISLDVEFATRNKNDFKGIPRLRFFEPKEIEN